MPPDTPTHAAASQPRVVAVACSGGRDSTALLHATAAAAHDLGLQVVALHVHHGLNPQADDWLRHLQAQVAAWASQGWPVRLCWERLEGAPAAGDSIEAWARAGRHQALQRMARDAQADLLLLAHHRRDQAETFLLQALRGAGMAGLAAMPEQQWRDGICWARPWLQQPAEAVQRYVQQHSLTHIEDDSNASLRFARNRLRHEVWPLLTAAAPGAEQALAQSATWAQEALALQLEMAEQDLAVWTRGLDRSVSAGAAEAEDTAATAATTATAAKAATAVPSEPGGPLTALAPSGPGQGPALLTEAWQRLSQARLSNLLRAWLRQESGRSAPASLVERLLREVRAAEVGRWPFGDHEVQLYRGRLNVVRAQERTTAHGLGHPKPQVSMDRASEPVDRSGGTTDAVAPALVMDLSRPGRYPVPAWRGEIEVFEVFPTAEVPARGLSASRLIKVELRPREGSARFQAHANGVPRSLKKCWQTAGIPAPQREGPLLYLAQTLVFVPSLGLDARCVEQRAEPLLALRWHPAACGCCMAC